MSYVKTHEYACRLPGKEVKDDTKNSRAASCGIYSVVRFLQGFQKRRARVVRSSSRDFADPYRGTGSSADLGIPKRMAAGVMGKDHRSSGSDRMTSEAERRGRFEKH